MSEPRLVFLIGMPASGKSTLGKRLAEKLSWDFIDLDLEIERVLGKFITDIFHNEGEGWFRKVEAEQLKALVNSCTTSSIVATGGGTPCFFDNIAYMLQKGFVIWVDTPLRIIEQRMDALEIKKRPLLASLGDKKEYLKELWIKRKIFYQQASLIYNPTGEELEMLIEKILESNTGSKHSSDIT